MASYSLKRFERQEGPKQRPRSGELASVTLRGAGAPFRRGMKRGIALGEATPSRVTSRTLPATTCGPGTSRPPARKIATKSRAYSVPHLDEKAMEKLGMGSLLSVSKGSREPAYLMHLVYKPKGKAPRVVFASLARA